MGERPEWGMPRPAGLQFTSSARLVLWHSIAAIPMAMVVVLGAYLSYHYHQLALENRNRVDHAYEVLDVVDGLFISVQNADVAQRDFIITGDDSHLAAFQAALRTG